MVDVFVFRCEQCYFPACLPKSFQSAYVFVEELDWASGNLTFVRGFSTSPNSLFFSRGRCLKMMKQVIGGSIFSCHEMYKRSGLASKSAPLLPGISDA